MKPFLFIYLYLKKGSPEVLTASLWTHALNSGSRMLNVNAEQLDFYKGYI